MIGTSFLSTFVFLIITFSVPHLVVMESSGEKLSVVQGEILQLVTKMQDRFIHKSASAWNVPCGLQEYGVR